jgi:hypothetical protein
MRSPIPAGRPRFTLKASHHRFSLKVSHRRSENEEALTREAERDRYIAPPNRRREAFDLAAVARVPILRAGA